MAIRAQIGCSKLAMDGTSAYCSDTCHHAAFAQMTTESLALQPGEITFVDRNGKHARLFVAPTRQPDHLGFDVSGGSAGKFWARFCQEFEEDDAQAQKKMCGRVVGVECVVVWSCLSMSQR